MLPQRSAVLLTREPDSGGEDEGQAVVAMICHTDSSWTFRFEVEGKEASEGDEEHYGADQQWQIDRILESVNETDSHWQDNCEQNRDTWILPSGCVQAQSITVFNTDFTASTEQRNSGLVMLVSHKVAVVGGGQRNSYLRITSLEADGDEYSCTVDGDSSRVYSVGKGWVNTAREGRNVGKAVGPPGGARGAGQKTLASGGVFDTPNDEALLLERSLSIDGSYCCLNAALVATYRQLQRESIDQDTVYALQEPVNFSDFFKTVSEEDMVKHFSKHNQVEELWLDQVRLYLNHPQSLLEFHDASADRQIKQIRFIHRGCGVGVHGAAEVYDNLTNNPGQYVLQLMVDGKAHFVAIDTDAETPLIFETDPDYTEGKPVSFTENNLKLLGLVGKVKDLRKVKVDYTGGEENKGKKRKQQQQAKKVKKNKQGQKPQSDGKGGGNSSCR